jgi:hypothetical protein
MKGSAAARSPLAAATIFPKECGVRLARRLHFTVLKKPRVSVFVKDLAERGKEEAKSVGSHPSKSG